MKKITVKNIGKRTRDRLGLRVQPGETKELEVSNREYLTIKAVKDFRVEVLPIKQENNTETDEDDTKTDKNTTDKAETSESQGDINYANLNIEEVIEAINGGNLDVTEAIALEVAGKNRPTLLEQLEEIQKGE